MKMFNRIIAIQGDSFQKINIKTDTTLLLALEAQKRVGRFKKERSHRGEQVVRQVAQ